MTLFSYDADGRVSKRWIYTEANGGATVLTNLNTSITYVRDLRDALTQRSDTTGSSFFYQWSDYDGRGLLWTVSAATTNVKPGTPDVTNTYRPSGQVASRLFSGGPTVPITYTIREQLAQIGDPAGTTSPFSAKYSYNANSTISTGEFYSGGSPATNKRYKYDFPTYDALNRLKSADYSFWNGSAWTTSAAYDLPSISYDANGNLTALQRNKDTGALIDNLTYTIAPASNRLNSIADAVGATAETWDAEAGSFTYDAKGNQLTAPGPYSITATTYDPRNLPLSLTIAGTTTNYRYDDAGQRITKQVGAGNTEVYVKEGTTTLGVFTVSSGGTLISSYFNLLAGDRVVGRQPSAGTRSYYHTDLLGSTRSVTQGVTITESYDYDPWGLLMPGRTLGSGTKEGFTSKERDVESQLDYFGARYYLAAVGRWAGVDPLGEKHWEWSPYGYVLDDPTILADPDGRQVRGDGLMIRLIDQAQRTAAAEVGAQADAIRLSMIRGLYDLAVVQGVFSSVEGVAGIVASEGRTAAIAEEAGALDASVGSARAFESSAQGSTGFISGQTETVQRAMSRAELDATRSSGLLRGGRPGTHFVSDAVNASPLRARQRLALAQTPEVRVTMEVPQGRLSAPSKIASGSKMPGGGTERTGSGSIPVRIKKVDAYPKRP